MDAEPEALRQLNKIFQETRDDLRLEGTILVHRINVSLNRNKIIVASKGVDATLAPGSTNEEDKGSSTPAEAQIFEATSDRPSKDSEEAQKNSDNPVSGRTHFLFNEHTAFLQHIDTVRQRIAEADIVINEDAEVFDDIYNAVAELRLTPEEAMERLEERARQYNITIFYPQETLALLRVIRDQSRNGHVVRIYGEKMIAEAMQHSAAADDARARFLGSLVMARHPEDLHWYNLMIRHGGLVYSLRDLVLNIKINEIRRENPQANILVIRGAVHTAPYILQKKQASGMVSREKIGRANIFDLDVAYQRDIAFQSFGLKAEKDFTPLQLAQSIISTLLLPTATLQGS